MLSRILPILFLASAMTLFAQVTTNPVAIAPGSDLPPIAPGVSLGLANWRAARYSDVRYKLNLTLEKMSPVLKGTIEIRVKVGAGTLLSPTPQGVNIPPIILDWRKIKGHEGKSTISHVTVNGMRPDAGHRDGVSAVGDRSVPAPIDEHLIFREGVVIGENVIKLDFTSPILTSGSAITRYVDKEDGAEYIYSLFVPSDASTAFPVFDQPDLKARFTLGISIPQSVNWNIVTNSALSSVLSPYCIQPSPRAVAWQSSSSEIVANSRRREQTESCGKGYVFEETKPISTYVFAFAAGPFERVSVPPALAGGTMLDGNPVSGKSETSPPADAGGTDRGERVSSPHVSKGSAAGVEPSLTVGLRTPPNIYVRKSQVEKFKPHAAEVFRLNREAIKYFEEYFDYKFPFPKYDLVLIPEFPFGGMEHAGATFLRESSIIFPQEPTKNDHISRAVLIFHEAAHQWFGDTVTMRWFDDLWLKEGFANFAAYKAMEKIMPETNAWKVFYERVKQAAYQTDSTKGTTPIYQEIKNLSAAKSAYGNIVYNKAPAFLRQAEFYLGEDKFQTAVRAFLKKHEFANAGWEDLVKEFEEASGQKLRDWASNWVTKRGMYVFAASDLGSVKNTINLTRRQKKSLGIDPDNPAETEYAVTVLPHNILGEDAVWGQKHKTLFRFADRSSEESVGEIGRMGNGATIYVRESKSPDFAFANYGDYGYGIFLLDDKSRDYVLKNIQNEKDPFLRAMMWGSLWDSVREGELDPREYVELVVKVLSKSDGFSRSDSGTPKGVTLTETLTEDESTIATLLGRVSTAMNYYLTDEQREKIAPRIEAYLFAQMWKSKTLGQRITFYRAYVNIAATDHAQQVLKKILKSEGKPIEFEIRGDVLVAGEMPKLEVPRLRTKDKFDIVTRLLGLENKRILGNNEAEKILAELEKAETSDEAKRYAYAAKAGIATAENKAKYWNDFVNNKEISESWIEAAFGPFNSIRHSELTLPYLQKALQELPNHKRSRKIFFVNGWLGAFIGGQRSEEALAIVNKFLADNPNLDKDLRLKILENVDVIERAVKIRAKYGKN